MTAREQEGNAIGATDELVDALAQTAFVTMGALTRLASDNDLSLTQLRVLAILRDRRLRMTDLVAYLGLEKSTLTGLVARAEARGLVVRVANPDDRRVVDVTLTDEGHVMAARLTKDLAGYLDPLVSSLKNGEQRALRELLVTALRTTPTA
ncbi:MarR family winged helix-turn-helix transcriptional regulator [Agreia bicolorata]|uniref:MarR family winged helix-turn-helix transcriptional regulator n=1 Tax=Agreia bicolorata TaxID=110935 RepID=UPI000B220618|nr:MarR family transcriptional regulator [Agreia bicolorata]